MENKMNYEITDDFIGIFDDVFHEELIQKYIDYFEHADQIGATFGRETRGIANHKIADKSTDLITGPFFIKNLNTKYISNEFITVFWELCYKPYVEKYSILNEMSAHKIFDIKIQKTEPGQGYHMWHSEVMNKESRDRLCAFMLYLNDVEEGGETEFLYLKKRFKPIKNRVLIWPAGYTHTHRGNQPISGSKYILTGWIELGV